MPLVVDRLENLRPNEGFLAVLMARLASRVFTSVCVDAGARLTTSPCDQKPVCGVIVEDSREHRSQPSEV